jgi:AcrR family transcriptional regulator
VTTRIAEPHNARSRRSRAALLDAARELITAGGFDALTMAAVAERAGVTRRAVYLHFATRAELVTALFSRLAETEDIGASLQRVWDRPDAASALAEWGRHLGRTHPRILPVMLAAERARHADPDAAALWHAGQQRWLAGARRLAGWLAREERLAPPWTAATAADMIWSLMSPDLLSRLINDRRWSPRRTGDHFAGLLTSTFARDQGEPSDVRDQEEHLGLGGREGLVLPAV